MLHRTPSRWITSALALTLLMLAGCSGSGRTHDGGAGMRSSSGTGGGSSGGTASIIGELSPDEADVEMKYVIGPAVARELGYRIDWQYISDGSALKSFAVQDDAVFTLDNQNFLTRLRREEGDRIWRIPVGRPHDEIQDIDYVAQTKRVYLSSGLQFLVLDAENGSQVARHAVERVVNTPSIRLGQFLVYGSRTGQLVWHIFQYGTEWKSYQVGRTVQVPPVYDSGHIVVVSADGRIMSLTADGASMVWTKKAIAPIVAAPAAGHGVVYTASLDQFVRAHEIGFDRTPRWEYLTESPLTDSPVLIGEYLYQHVDAMGLLCLDALPLDSPGGKLVWKASEATGSVITSLRDRLITWDADTHMLQIVDARLGTVIWSVHMPQMERVIATDVENGELFATGYDGRIVRLVPRN